MLTDRQRAFFRDLLGPFDPRAYYTTKRGNREFTYLKSRTIMNRLDDVTGPMGWAAEYTETTRGYKCRIKICCPDHTPDGWAWHYKEDGAGPEDMGAYNKETKEWETDVDNDEKSAYTNAFRRAAASWGFGRDLYNEGVPHWLADLFGQGQAPRPSAPVVPGRPATPPPGARPESVPPRGPAAPAAPQRQRDLSPPSKAGKAPFAWIMGLQDHFKVSGILDRATRYCKAVGWPDRTDQLDDAQVVELTGVIVDWCKTQDFYGGEFGDAEPRAQEPPRSVPGGGNGKDLPGKPAPTNGAPAADPLAGLKRAIIAGAQALVCRQTGRDATQDEVKAAVGEIAALSVNCRGVTGEVLEGLKGCTDKVWLGNMSKEVTRQIERAAQQESGVDDLFPVGADDIPF